MALTPGSQLGTYEILAPLGAGGMGEVYHARDLRLGRDVAIKALPEAFAADPERLARFEREARLLASLNHPNIAGIHGLEEVAGTRYLVLEFVEGETLEAHLEHGALSVAVALDLGRQIATGVEAAHEAGVVHRDLKPGNVMLTPDGAVKVLDFGLAKGGAAAGDSSSDPRLSASPTMTYAATQAGMILGTAAYMSPEQARGRAVDRRTDIWSFGCVLYEMLSGRRAFHGETVSDVMARILEREPDWSALPVGMPDRLRWLVGRCLVKDPRERLRDMGEARIALEGIAKGGSDSGILAAPSHPPARTPVALRIGVPLLAAVLSAAATWLLVRAPAPQPVALSVILPREERLQRGPDENNLLALAPDGRSLAYTSAGNGPARLFLRRLDRPGAVELPGTEDARDPFFSPDGDWIAFFAGRHLLKASVHGGTPVEIADVADDRGGAWLEDGSILFTPSFASPLYRVDAQGGDPRPVTTLDSTRNERTHRWPCVLPGGEWVVFTVGLMSSPGGYDDARIEAVSLKTGERRTLARGSCARYAPSAHLVFARGGSLYAMPLDPRNPRGGATAVPVLDGVLGVRTSGVAFFDIARDGTLALVMGRETHSDSRLEWIDLEGRRSPIPVEPRGFNQIVLSPDGNRALAQIGSGGGNGDVFLIDLVRGNATQVTFGGHEGSPHWMPDGQHFVWSRSAGTGGDEIVVRSLFGSDTARVVTRSSFPLSIGFVRADGGAILFHEYGNPESDILEASTDGSGTVRTLVREPLGQTSGCLSPDGRWIAYVSSESGMAELCVRPLGRAGGRVQISTNGGILPAWSPDGHELYYVSSGALMATTVTPRGGVMFADSTRRLFDLPRLGSDTSDRICDLHPSGRKFLVRAKVGDPDEMREISVRLNWARSLRSRGSRAAP